MSRLEKVYCLAVTALLCAATSAFANPLGGKVVGGSATIQGQGTPGVVIDQSSQNAIINWQSFNIGAGEVTQFVQPNSSSVSLNRVTGDQNPSTIFGTLNANGRVFLVNPDGFLFGPGSSINTAGFLATTHDIRNEDFLAGRYNFNIPGNSLASIVNEGTITVGDAGIAALVAPGVRNDGVITARLGKIGLASANSFTLDLYGDNLINFSLTDPIAGHVIDVKTGKPLTSLVENRGKLSANGGVVALTATTARALVNSVVNNSGVIEAQSVGVHNGKIVLGAATAKTKLAGSPKQRVVVQGKLDASGKGQSETGGEIEIVGEGISVASALVDASGDAGGGKVLIGGDTGGGTPTRAAAANPIAGLEITAIPTASSVSIDAGTTIDASALNQGNGGKAVVWSDGTTNFDGLILARGGAVSGNGGFIETSGHDGLQFSGRVDTTAVNGLTGTLLLDPKDVTIRSTGTWIVTVSALQAALGSNNVVVNTSAAGTDAGNITVAQSVTWANGNSLTLSADHDITVMPGVSITNTSSGNLVLHADNTGTGAGSVNLSSGAVNFSGSTGAVSIFYNPPSYASPTSFSPFVSTMPGQLTAYMLVNSLTDLQNIQLNLVGDYALGKSIDASATALPTYNGGAGFAALGNGNNVGTSFQGVFDGQGFAIDGLTINSPGSFAAPFGLLYGTIRNVALTNESISGLGAAGLVRNNVGTIDHVAVTGSINGGLAGAGGLVGDNNGAINNSSTNVTVQAAHGGAGGIANSNYGNIFQTSSSGVVTQQFDGQVGGLVVIAHPPSQVGAAA